MKAKSLLIFLATPPYGGQNAYTALRLAEAALGRGHRVRLFASADGVHIAQVGQRAVGAPDALAALQELIPRGLQVELCGSCLRYRGLNQDLLAEGTEPSSLQGLFSALREADAFVSLTG